jgi:hypothetical protein
MRALHRTGIVAASGLLAVTGGMLSATAAAADDNGAGGDHHAGRVLFVSPSGRHSNSGGSCTTARYSTVQAAVDAARSGATVHVCKGTYAEDVIVSKPLTLLGHHATIKGTSTAHGMCEQLGASGPGSAPCLAGLTIKSSWVTVSGFTVKGAVGEGILATGSLKGGSISRVKITGNTVVGNDRGGIPPSTTSPYPQCVEVGQIPGDCGEGIHLMGVAKSVVASNYVSGNSGGVLLTDEFGPTHGNLVKHNVIKDNLFDCGVTAPGHNPSALDSKGHRQPSVAGVYDNVIRGNSITGNGVKGEGAGVLFANAGPGTAAYNNLVVGNYIAGNELAGVTMHAHSTPPGVFEDLSGNRVIGNLIGKNNTGGDPLDAPGLPVQDTVTTGVLVFSGTVPLKVTIRGNGIFDNKVGIWLGVGGHVKAKVARNTFHNVGTPVLTHP